MTAATSDRDIQEVRGLSRSYPMEAATKIYAGTIACLNAANNLTKGITSAALTCVGVMESTVDNSAGAAGALQANVRAGIYGPFANSAGGDLIARKNAGSSCYIVDDSTVALTSNSGVRSVAGTVFDVDASGVWVRFA